MNEKMESAFRKAFRTDDVERVRCLVEAEDSPGVCVHIQGPRNPLHLACTYLCPNVLIYLVEHGADINDNSPGMTPLQIAHDSQCFDVVFFLVKLGGDVHTVDKEGYSLLHFVCGKTIYEDAMELIVLLLRFGVDINGRSPSGVTPLHKAYTGAATDYLCKHGANVNAVDNQGMTPFLMACDSGQLTRVRFLKMHGADINAINAQGFNAFHFTTQSELVTLDLILCLFEMGANPIAVSREGKTPFHLLNQVDTPDWPQLALWGIWAGISGRAEHDVTVATQYLLDATCYHGIAHERPIHCMADLLFTYILFANIPLLPLNHKMALDNAIHSYPYKSVRGTPLRFTYFLKRPAKRLLLRFLRKYRRSFPTLTAICRAAVRNHLGASLLRPATVTEFFKGELLPITVVHYIYLYDEAMRVFNTEAKEIERYFKIHSINQTS